MFGWTGSSLLTIVGMITLNQAAIVVGILTGISTIGLNIYTFLSRRKEAKSKK
jgi:Bacteriophage holin family HP1